MSHQIGDRASCDCGRILIYTSNGWKHGGLGSESDCTPHPVAMPIDEPEIDSNWVGVFRPKDKRRVMMTIEPVDDAPENEADDRILVESGILPLLIDAATNTIHRPGSIAWEQELAEIGEDEPIDHADAIHALTALTAQIVGVLARAGVHKNLCESTEYQIHQLWTMALRTVGDA